MLKLLIILKRLIFKNLLPKSSRSFEWKKLDRYKEKLPRKKFGEKKSKQTNLKNIENKNHRTHIKEIYYINYIKILEMEQKLDSYEICACQ